MNIDAKLTRHICEQDRSFRYTIFNKMTTQCSYTMCNMGGIWMYMEHHLNNEMCDEFHESNINYDYNWNN